MESSATQRLQGLDALRGIAILLMILDHALNAWEATNGYNLVVVIIRATVTRPALPILMGVAGYLWARKKQPRPMPGLKYVILGLGTSAVATATGGKGLDILALFGVCMFAAPVVVRWPVTVLALGILQTINLPVRIGWYEPGYVLAWLALGVVAFRQGKPIPSLAGARWLAWVGRRPLAWYVGHLAALAVIVQVLQKAK